MSSGVQVGSSGLVGLAGEAGTATACSGDVADHAGGGSFRNEAVIESLPAAAGGCLANQIKSAVSAASGYSVAGMLEQSAGQLTQTTRQHLSVVALHPQSPSAPQ